MSPRSVSVIGAAMDSLGWGAVVLGVAALLIVGTILWSAWQDEKRRDQ